MAQGHKRGDEALNALPQLRNFIWQLYEVLSCISTRAWGKHPYATLGRNLQAYGVPLSITPGNGHVREAVIYQRIQQNRSAQPLSPHQNISVASLKSPWHRKTYEHTELMYAVVIGILGSAQPLAVQHRPFTAVISSHWWLHARSWHPIFSLQLLSPPGLLLQSHPASTRLPWLCRAAVWGRPCRTSWEREARLPAAAAQERTCLHVEESQAPVVLSRTSKVLQDAQTLSSPEGLPLDTLSLPFAQQNCFAGGVGQLRRVQPTLLWLVMGLSPPGFQWRERGDGTTLAFPWKNTSTLQNQNQVCIISHRHKPSCSPAFVLCTSSFFCVSTPWTDVLQCAFVVRAGGHDCMDDRQLWEQHPSPCPHLSHAQAATPGQGPQPETSTQTTLS